MDMVIKNGRIVSGGMTFLGDVLIEGETIKAVGKNIPEEGRCVIDAVGKYVIPGAVDVHTHMDLQAGQCRLWMIFTMVLWQQPAAAQPPL